MAIVFIIAATACWGYGVVVSKSVLDVFPPLVLLVIQLAASLVLTWSVVLIARLKIPRFGEAIRPALVGLLEPGIAYLFGLIGLAYTSAAVASLLLSLETVFVIVLAVIFIGEKITRGFALLAATSFIGVIILLGVDATSLSKEHGVFGDFMVLLGVLSASCYTITSSKYVWQINPAVLVAMQHVVGLIFAVIMCLILTDWIDVLSSTTSATLGQWGLACLAGILHYAIPFWLYLLSLRYVSVSVVGMFLTLVPIFGVHGSILFLDETITPNHYIGGSLVVASLFIISLLEWKRDKESTDVANVDNI